MTFNPELDLVLERVIPVKPATVWKLWTEAEHLKKWFCPAPWSIAHCEIDLRPGGRFHSVMRSPEGQEFPNDGCYLEIVEGKRLVFTDALGPGYRPTGEGFMTAVVEIMAHPEGTRYVATALHANPEARAKHEEMGFHHGWGAALDQLVALGLELEGGA